MQQDLIEWLSLFILLVLSIITMYIYKNWSFLDKRKNQDLFDLARGYIGAIALTLGMIFGNIR